MQYLVQDSSRVPQATTAEGKGRILKELVASELVRQKMREEGWIDAGASAAEQQAAFEAFAAEKFPVPESPAEPALRAHYERNQHEFGIPAAVRLSQIQIRVPKDADAAQREAARGRAEEALARLENGEPFAEVAKDMTENPREAGSDGDLGFVWRDGDPWLDAALQGIEVGERTGILDSRVGFDILLLTDERPAVVPPFEQVRDEVAEHLRRERRESQKDEYVRALAKQTPVELALPELQAAFPEGLFDE
jgi:parvulin-like peptidyl-prolyl isomerase